MMRQGCHYRTGSVRLASIDLRSFRMTAFWTNCAWSSCRRLNLYQIASTANPFWLAVFVISEVFSIRSHHVIKLNILYIGVAKEFIIVQTVMVMGDIWWIQRGKCTLWSDPWVNMAANFVDRVSKQISSNATQNDYFSETPRNTDWTNERKC